MKKTIFIIALLVSSLYAKNTADIINPYIQAWQPLKVDYEKGSLVIVLNQPRVTKDIYMAIMKSGICMSSSFEKWDGVQRITIMNKHIHQGWIFDGGYADCKEAFKKKGNLVDISIMGKSRLY